MTDVIRLDILRSYCTALQPYRMEKPEPCTIEEEYELRTCLAAALATPALTPKQAAADEMFEAINDYLDNDGTRGVFDGRGIINARNRLFAALAKAGRP